MALPSHLLFSAASSVIRPSVTFITGGFISVHIGTLLF